jgi:hypothetical protein
MQDPSRKKHAKYISELEKLLDPDFLSISVPWIVVLLVLKALIEIDTKKEKL